MIKKKKTKLVKKNHKVEFQINSMLKNKIK